RANEWSDNKERTTMENSNPHQPADSKLKRTNSDHTLPVANGIRTVTTKETHKIEPIRTAYFDGLVDLVEKDDRPAFLIKKDGVPEVVFKHTIDGRTALPPLQLPWLLPKANEVLKHHAEAQQRLVTEVDQKLFGDLIQYHKSISQLPNEAHFTLLAAWV